MAIIVTGGKGSADATPGAVASKGVYSHAEGASTATGDWAHSEGLSTSASGNGAHAEGGASTASQSYAHAEGQGCTASAQYSHAEGFSSISSGDGSHAEGNTCTASGLYSHSEGQESTATRYAQHSKASGKIAAVGDAQLANFVARRSTTDATPAVLTFTGAALDAAGNDTNVLTVAVAWAYKFRLEVIARRTDVQGTVAGWTIEGVIARETSGNVRIVGSPLTTSWADSGAAAWTVACTADTTNQCLAMTVTGEAAKTIRWVGALYTVEVG